MYLSSFLRNIPALTFLFLTSLLIISCGGASNPNNAIADPVVTLITVDVPDYSLNGNNGRDDSNAYINRYPYEVNELTSVKELQRAFRVSPKADGGYTFGIYGSAHSQLMSSSLLVEVDKQHHFYLSTPVDFSVVNALTTILQNQALARVPLDDFTKALEKIDPELADELIKVDELSYGKDHGLLRISYALTYLKDILNKSTPLNDDLQKLNDVVFDIMKQGASTVSALIPETIHYPVSLSQAQIDAQNPIIEFKDEVNFKKHKPYWNYNYRYGTTETDAAKIQIVSEVLALYALDKVLEIAEQISSGEGNDATLLASQFAMNQAAAEEYLSRALGYHNPLRLSSWIDIITESTENETGEGVLYSFASADLMPTGTKPHSDSLHYIHIQPFKIDDPLYSKYSIFNKDNRHLLTYSYANDGNLKIEFENGDGDENEWIVSENIMTRYDLDSNGKTIEKNALDVKVTRGYKSLSEKTSKDEYENMLKEQFKNHYLKITLLINKVERTLYNQPSTEYRLKFPKNDYTSLHLSDFSFARMRSYTRLNTHRKDGMMHATMLVRPFTNYASTEWLKSVAITIPVKTDLVRALYKNLDKPANVDKAEDGYEQDLITDYSLLAELELDGMEEFRLIKFYQGAKEAYANNVMAAILHDVSLYIALPSLNSALYPFVSTSAYQYHITSTTSFACNGCPRIPKRRFWEKDEKKSSQ